MKPRTLALIAGAILAPIAVVTTVFLTGPSNNQTQLEPATVTAGQDIYDKNCASCHGLSGEGQANWKEPKPDGTRPDTRGIILMMISMRLSVKGA